MNLSELIVNSGNHNDPLYVSMSSSNGKTWLLPVNSIITGLELYQPSSLKGVLIKRTLPFIAALRIRVNRVGIDYENVEALPSLLRLLDTFFEDDYELAFFGGTPSVDRKVTIQISSNQNILGYLKVSDKDRVRRLFQSEADNLSYLKGRGMTGIPDALFVGEQGGLYFFLQSCVKHNGYKTSLKLCEEHWSYLDRLARLTCADMRFRCTDFCSSLLSLLSETEGYGSFRDIELAEVRSSAKEMIKRFDGGHVNFSFYHGDFTPWNTVLNADGLWAFDFEYSQKYMPAYMDAVHYFLQPLLMKRSVRAEAVFEKLIGFRDILNRYVDDPNLLIEEYLLVVIEQYLSRGHAQSDADFERTALRVKLLELIRGRVDAV